MMEPSSTILRILDALTEMNSCIYFGDPTKALEAAIEGGNDLALWQTSGGEVPEDAKHIYAALEAALEALGGLKERTEDEAKVAAEEIQALKEGIATLKEDTAKRKKGTK